MSSDVRRIVLDPARERRGASTRPLPRWLGAASWLVAPLLLGAMLAGLALLRQGHSGIFTAALLFVCAVPLVWGLVSLVFPAYADRRCPECHSLGLQSISEDEVHGVRCENCGHEDETVGTWKFAEERDAPLEPLVIASRRRPLPLSRDSQGRS